MQNELLETCESLTDEVKRFYEKYATQNKLTIAEAKTFLNSKELEISYDAYLQLVREALDGSENADKILNASLTRRRITRLEALNMQIEGLLAILGGKLEEGLELVLQSVGEYAMLPEKAIETIVFSDGQWSERIWGHVANLNDTVKKVLRDGIAAGKGYDVLAEKIQDRTGVAMSSCRRLVYTECAYAQEQATLTRYRDADIKRYEFIATLDNKTCAGVDGHSCGNLDGQIFDVDAAQIGVNYPPMHPNCRCTTAAIFGDEDEEEEYIRAARDENGKVYYVSSKTTYAQWRQNKRKS
ncbi:MAG: minor capsid protein [Christensenellaceae bacterium]